MKQHYCVSCKRMVPLAVNTEIGNPYITVGVAHVNGYDNCSPCHTAGRRTYRRDEQYQNLEILLVELEEDGFRQIIREMGWETSW